MARAKARPIDPATQARAKRAAAEVVASWSTEQLTASLAGDRLAKAWAISLHSARDVIASEQRRRDHSKRFG
ncbi:hypothetical protein [Croceicoccus sp. YJ47]|uniref:hypothetical protein n=1 Tax=Croceicoccus sp. YJ47 TaxID=2798724 RepID=UPI0019226C86|nr:hypothetical protein [Croceicoccus sp. YJ47]QQN73140.1 hypothetical protein JD971_09685 [Croceicoccus sp. YJ47]